MHSLHRLQGSILKFWQMKQISRTNNANYLMMGVYSKDQTSMKTDINGCQKMTFVSHALGYVALVWQGLKGLVTRVPLSTSFVFKSLSGIRFSCVGLCGTMRHSCDQALSRRKRFAMVYNRIHLISKTPEIMVYKIVQICVGTLLSLILI